MSDAVNTPQAQEPTELLDAGEVARVVARIAHQIIEKTALDSSDGPRVVLLGIPSGGVPLAERLAEHIENFSGIRPETGSLDITLYRDDLRARPHRALLPTQIPNTGIDGTIVVLVDDVLFSGRTIRAALDAVNDIGRPDIIQLAVLVDRGHRQLPIRADYVGKNLPTARHEEVRVLVEAIDGRDAVLLSRGAE
ncbi:bifunctional pyr operon transcriptional regulator/uracil phosphoribosyltransferase PyrR [Corynebacterium sp. TAE3-ERU12]|uniref:bifunctional pyr operon transcriptional regulator/uracil phosphoribosyltransferase PyrR n=1 Tax=Corynebacterium sp. TAE3-ERU12 TaxID=2849491 RepID=UPI001C458EAB|nr:bifunctional pyr operon transcriptional regulator/uracil phosphoribosyltransferase PyrR [Corynebacterium sp. TAE3-ERU12]MBV7295384.1 bifunctional pyr operon transcriptional regulator/uracil phosphoribosyltransferase PyrR [Corynebacterium sp. TAE3-ERU12]